MKWLKYRLCHSLNNGTEENPKLEDSFTEIALSWSERNEEIAKREAYNGEYTIEDDGQPEPVVEPTTDEILNAMLGVSE